MVANLYYSKRRTTVFFRVVYFLNVNLDLMADIKVGLPFVPFGMVV